MSNQINKNDNQFKKIDIQKLIQGENINDIIIEIDNYICTLCEWGDKMENLSNAQKFFYYNQNLEREINNGGFSQYFFNSTGDYAHETVDSLIAINANHTAKILKKAIAQFPENKVPKNSNLREEIIEKIEEEANIVWEELENDFFKYEDNLNELNLKFVKENLNSF
ncbi:DMP19 family protein [Flavobacterium fluviale]|uniref:DNA mimic protein DMP19 C-terminal domain-containing protein n=1 Tax=Flavobacterium fluviale TaxID=2249356 RepID=A0A344LSN4_9FLAO|nr:DMP19 family protein [Flavobacterium fluviale]AXB56926.1 hypothetical protein HYN86_10105 [Flavobacterium fluviale]